MSDTRKYLILMRAVQRLSPRMALFMARRVLRNKLAPRFPVRYRARLATIEKDLPALSGPRGELPPGLLVMAEIYSSEYREVMDRAREGRIVVLGREIDFGAPAKVDWNHHVPEEGDHQLWRVKMSHMGVLCPMIIEGERDHHLAVTALAKGALENTDPTAPGAFDAYWFPYAASHRILALTAGLIVARSRKGLPQETDQAVSDLLRHNVAFLLDNVEHELNNNHVERNLAALCLYFSYAESVPTRIAARLERDVAHLLETTILPDGCQVERSPMYQGLSVASLAIMAETPFLSGSLRSKLQERQAAAHRAFAILSHPDGEVALFNDSWHGEAPHYRGLEVPVGRVVLSHGGYARLSRGDDVCLMDAGPLGPAWNPGHGHADFLSVEITLDKRRLIVDPGTSHYNTGADRTRERSAAAHNGPGYDGYEPVEFLGSFKVGKLAQARLLPEQELGTDTIGGTFYAGPGKIARLVRHYPGRGFLVADLWDTSSPRGRVSWLVPTEWQISTSESGKLQLEQGNARAWIAPLLAASEDLHVTPSHWASHYGHRRGAHELLLRPHLAVSRQQTLLCWIGSMPPPTSAHAEGQALLEQLSSLVTRLPQESQ
ncbi:heparinase II/III family protein [Salipiger profundus]|uniref:heparinase II/III family protein n=1 Tax=Salipiger profundus TaxID=1229727 RepID=UPI0008EAF221|nr:heparinase II/III family protein [Salipiger profundus]SFD73946.1 Heparinase II/III-like protein [Salipiger profundus]